jgi:PAS domain S-box-containing protein
VLVGFGVARSPALVAGAFYTTHPRAMKRLLTVLIGVLLGATIVPAWAQASLRVGVLAFRPKAQAAAQWQPLATYLSAALARPVVLTTYDLPELDAAVDAKAVDVVFTTPGHFIALQHVHQLSEPLATQVTLHQDSELSAFGGVIFTRADRTAIATLADLANQRIALTSMAFLGGYQMQAVELLDAGLALPQPDQLLATGMPQDQVIEAVLGGKADVGFVRTGVLEAMAREGTLDLNQIKVIHRQNPPHFPWLTSTRLYPDWPVALLPGVDASTARRLAVALLSLPADHPAAKVAQIHGFTIAADYSRVDGLLRRLHMPPYDAPTTLNLREVWAQHSGTIAAVLGVLILVMAGGGGWLVRQNGLIRQSRQRHREQSNQISEIIWGTNVGTWEWDISTGGIVVNARWAEMLGFTPKELGPLTIERWMERTHADDVATSSVMIEQCFTRAEKDYHCDVRMRHKSGEWVWVMNRGRVVQWALDGKPHRMAGTQLDIADRKRAELREQHHNRVLQMLAAKTPLVDVLASIALDVQSTCSSARCCILLLDADSKALRLGAAPGLPDFFIEGLESLGAGQGIGPCAQAALNAATVVVPDIANDPACAAMADLARRANVRACWSQPIVSSMGAVLGSFSIYRRHTATPEPEDLQMLQDEARLCALVIEKTADQPA